MPVELKARSSSPSDSFTWQNEPSPPTNPASLASSPTVWLPGQDMKVFGAEPLSSISDVGIGLVKCKECAKPILASCASEHAETTCASIRSKKSKGKAGADSDASKKRKASPSPDEPNKKKTKTSPTKPAGNNRRPKGPVDFDKQCGVMTDKDIRCSRSLTCKSHSMGAKRAVQGRSKDYDALLLDWQRANNPNFVEPVKKETKAEKKAKKEAEKAEKRRLAAEAAAATGPSTEPNASGSKKSSSNKDNSSKKNKRTAAAAAAAVRLAEGGDGDAENLDDLDSEAEIDELVKSVRVAKDKGHIAVPLAVPCDASSWFVQRSERTSSL